jgi:hypothetical protein
MNIKKIFQSFDFRGNKLINTKTNTPTDSEHIVPKSYVDENTKYNTQKADDYGNSPKFSWVTNVFNKTFKQLFDDLLFPQINPIYLNPTFSNIDLFVFDEYNITLDKKAIFLNRLTKFRIDYKISESDRISGVTPKIIIVTNDNNTTEYLGTLTSDVEGFIEFEFIFTNILSITLRKEFQEATVTKQDNYGNDYIPNDFTINYNLDFDVLNLINEKHNIYPPMLYYKMNTGIWEDIIEAISDGDNLVSDSSLSMFIKNRKISSINGNNNIFIIGIPEPLYNKSSLLIHINNYIIPLDIENLKNNLNVASNYNNIKELSYYNSDINYYFGIVDFGTFLESKQINFQYNLYKS